MTVEGRSQVSTLLIKNIGEFFTGDIARPQAAGDVAADRRRKIAALDPPADTKADAMLDAGGSAVMPGLVDGHIHPVFGEWTPTQDTIGWIGNYVHGGTTTWSRPASCTCRASTTRTSRPISSPRSPWSPPPPPAASAGAAPGSMPAR